ncbi:MAG: glutamate racemase [Clostridia bacterium BRH_c25]|nr:MAG: glutamate racemase [Clostridia bacterium BRH_c25]
MSVGVFDSGIGGLTVLKEALRLMPNEDYMYYADTRHVPYGTKPKEEVRGYIFDAVDFFASQGVEALIIACNTATSIAINDLRERYSFPIIGMEPAVKPAVEKADNRRVLVLATPITVREKKLHDLVESLDSEDIVDLHALPGLVEFAEKFIFDEDTVIRYLLDEFSGYNLREYGAVVLGCTHFVFFRKYFKMILPQEVDIIDGNMGTVNRLRNLLENRGLSFDGKGKTEFYCSGKRELDDSKYKRYLELDY